MLRDKAPARLGYHQPPVGREAVSIIRSEERWTLHTTQIRAALTRAGLDTPSRQDLWPMLLHTHSTLIIDTKASLWGGVSPRREFPPSLHNGRRHLCGTSPRVPGTVIPACTAQPETPNCTAWQCHGTDTRNLPKGAENVTLVSEQAAAPPPPHLAQQGRGPALPCQSIPSFKVLG